MGILGFDYRQFAGLRMDGGPWNTRCKGTLLDVVLLNYRHELSTASFT